MATVFGDWGSRTRQLGGFAAVVVAAAYQWPVTPHAAPEAVDRAFARFWAAEDPKAAASQVDAVVASGVAFDDAVARLREGRPYSGDVQRGRRNLTHRMGTMVGAGFYGEGDQHNHARDLCFGESRSAAGKEEGS